MAQLPWIAVYGRHAVLRPRYLHADISPVGWSPACVRSSGNTAVKLYPDNADPQAENGLLPVTPAPVAPPCGCHACWQPSNKPLRESKSQRRWMPNAASSRTTSHDSPTSTIRLRYQCCCVGLFLAPGAFGARPHLSLAAVYCPV